MIIAFDLDGTITDFNNCPKRTKGYWCWEYCKIWNCPLTPDIPSLINKLHFKGHKIVIYTGRTTEKAKETEQYLSTHEIKYDKIVYNKFRAHIYIDDFGLKFVNIKSLLIDIENEVEIWKKRLS